VLVQIEIPEGGSIEDLEYALSRLQKTVTVDLPDGFDLDNQPEPEEKIDNQAMLLEAINSMKASFESLHHAILNPKSQEVKASLDSKSFEIACKVMIGQFAKIADSIKIQPESVNKGEQKIKSIDVVRKQDSITNLPLVEKLVVEYE